MACCMVAPSRDLFKCWIIVKRIPMNHLYSISMVTVSTKMRKMHLKLECWDYVIFQRRLVGRTSKICMCINIKWAAIYECDSKNLKRYLCKIEHFAYEKLTNRALVNPPLTRCVASISSGTISTNHITIITAWCALWQSNAALQN